MILIIIIRNLFFINNIEHSDFRTKGVPFIEVDSRTSIFKIGKNFAMNNSYRGNRIGYNNPCTMKLAKNCSIIIGDNVGISQTTLIAHANIIIKNNVKIGCGVKIYTSDFHSLDPKIRASIEDLKYKKACILHDANIQPDYLKPNYSCKICNDKGNEIKQL